METYEIFTERTTRDVFFVFFDANSLRCTRVGVVSKLTTFALGFKLQFEERSPSSPDDDVVDHRSMDPGCADDLVD